MLQLNYHHLYCFWIVGKEGGFTRAAERLRIAQSAVSLQVGKLESFLGHRLLIRSTSKKITFTEEGRAVFEQAEEIFVQGNELVTGIRTGVGQTAVRIGAIGSLSKNLQVRFLSRILKARKTEISVDVGDYSTLLGRLNSFQLDAILCDIPYPSSEDEPIHQREIAKEIVCLVGSKDTAGKKSDLKQQLESRGLFLPSKSNPITAQVLSFLDQQKIHPPIRGYMDDIGLIRLCALETDALIVVPRVGVERELKAKTLVVHHEFSDLYQRFYLVLRRRGARSKRLVDLFGLK
jgi:LysR family transcriptional regulator, transcriptional activator of nhaA